MRGEKVEVTLTRKGLIILALILVILDLFSTFLVARVSPEFFIENESNPLIKMLFLKVGWASFLICFFIDFLIYSFLINLGFWLWEKGMINKGYFYFLWGFVSAHIFVVFSNFVVLTKIANFK